MAEAAPRVALIGAGRMGGALLTGWLARGLPGHDIAIFDPAPLPELQNMAVAAGCRLNPPRAAVLPPAVMLLAVKPQAMPEILPDYVPLCGPQTVVLSIAAGRSLHFLEGWFGVQTAIVRAMPNTPAAIGRGATVACANDRAQEGHRRLCTELLAAVGEVFWAEEGVLDAVTALSGSGPAYVFHLTECLVAAGVAAGLDPALAERLARLTVSGAGELLHRSAESPAALRTAVTSPGGTTAAALDVLMGPDGLAPLIARAVEAAARRSRELAG
jgi:pyrroline-5-carboxylate reductase